MNRLHLVFLAAALAATSLASAQATYRWVDKVSGQTVYSDQPPPPGTPGVVKLGSEAGGATPQVPYATRQAAGKYPVTLYTAASCTDACTQARELLNQRGVPFTEKMLNTEEDQAEFAKQMGSKDVMVPSLTVGQQKFRGLESGAWNNLLDLAGYPKTAPFGAKPSGAFAE
ncbi:MAG: glutaredoxin family protein [Propionivibrio sp.]|jgi:glutaredoxin|uniref:glutaredoxin family protein n=1 Tax=Propionivibrio sp. TaxID=2212460 RepID=UPI001B61EE39|nr:glutaredoxin family protein [Propionivibrio sp.]MBP7204440.1 glutaredoxin family protein [Propionivibrio sp.]MBP8214997.1 glutaredoxin family protein [Propionivibrio sp.]